MTRYMLAVALAVVVPTAAAGQTSYANTIAQSSETVRKIMKEKGVQGASVALLDHDQVVWSQGFGWADRDRAIPVTPETVFHVGSVSKMFAVTAALVLVDEGKIVLDAPVTRYLPAFRLRSSGYEKITVRMLLNHQSGMPGGYYNWAATTAPVLDFNRRALDWLAGEYEQYPPGYFSVYTNNGFDMVAEIVATISGKSYPQFVRDRILTPLAMTRTGIDWMDPALQVALSKGYSGDKEMAPEILNMLGTGGFASTPSDMCRLLAMYNGRGTAFGATVLKPATVREMEKDQTLQATVRIPGASISPGLGWDVYADPAMAYAGAAPTKGGDSLLFGTQILTLPELQLGVTVIINRAESSLARTMAEQILMAAVEERYGIAPPGPVKFADPETPGFDLHTLEGSYGSAVVKGVWDLRTDGSALELWARRGDSLTRYYDHLTYRKDGWFANDADTSREFAVQSFDGRDVLLMRTNGGDYWSVDAIGERLEAPPVLSAAWKARIGKTWVAADLGMADYYFGARTLGLQLIEREGRLVYETFATGSEGTDNSLALVPIDDSHAFIPLRVDCRDITHLQVIAQGGEEWLRVGTGPSLWRPVESIPAPQGFRPYTASIAPDRTEWVKLAAGANEYVLNVPDAVHWALYNERLQPIFDAWGGAWRLGQPAGSKGSTLYLGLYSISAQQAVVQRLQGSTFDSVSGVRRIK